MGNALGSEASTLTSRRLLLALDEAVLKLEAVERSKAEPIAIVGMSCRFPGGATAEVILVALCAMESMLSPKSLRRDGRWTHYYDPQLDATGKMYTRYGGFLEDIDQFDPQFFGISPREAATMDPQQRLVLEVSWEALETLPASRRIRSAAARPVCSSASRQRLRRGSQAGAGPTRASMCTRPPAARSTRRRAGCRTHSGLQGPCMAIDTACSSSLVASTRPARACAAARAILRWPVASICYAVPECHLLRRSRG